MPIELSIHADGSRLNVCRRLAARNTVLALLMAASVALFWAPLRNLVTLCMGSEEYSYILLIPIMVLGLFYLEQRTIFKDLHYSVGGGTLLIWAVWGLY